jgi:general secretion pathway protein G
MQIQWTDSRGEKGFSLIELIVVLVILGLLAAVVGPKLINKLGESKEKIAKLQIAEFGNSLQLYALDVGKLPDSSEGLEALVRNPGNVTAWHGPYVTKSELPKDPWGHPYIYRAPGQHSEYDIISAGPDGSEGTEDDVVSWK